MVLHADPFDLHGSQPPRAGRHPRRVAMPAKVDQDVDTELSRAPGQSVVIQRADIFPRPRHRLKAHGDRVGRFQCMRQADDPERRRIEVLDSGDGQPANRMGTQRAGQQADRQQPVAMGVLVAGALVPGALAPGALVGTGRSPRGSTAAQSRAARSSAAPVTPS